MGFPASQFVNLNDKWCELGRTEIPQATINALYERVLFREMTLEIKTSFKKGGFYENRLQFFCEGVVTDKK